MSSSKKLLCSTFLFRNSSRELHEIRLVKYCQNSLYVLSRINHSFDLFVLQVLMV